MPDCFISHSTKDQPLTNFVHSELTGHGLDVFLASVSLGPGERWSETILTNLKTSSWVIFLASKAACQSAYVQQEFGIALGLNKKLIPVIWDITILDLPGWLNHFQALDLRGATLKQIQARIFDIAQTIKQDKEQGAFIAGALILGLLYFGSRS